MSLAVKDLGPCQVLFNGVDMGPTHGGVTFKEELHSVDIHEDGHADTPVDSVFTGRIATLEAKFTRLSLAQLAALIESATAGANNLKVKNSVGNTMFADAKEVILKPLVDNIPSATTTEWLHIHRAYPIASVELGFDNQNQRIISVTFKCFPDDASGQVNDIWRAGPAS